jgi:hypothetical protein
VLAGAGAAPVAGSMHGRPAYAVHCLSLAARLVAPEAAAEGRRCWRPFFIRYPALHDDRLASRRLQQPPPPDWSFRAIVLETPDPPTAAAWRARPLGVRTTHVDRAPQVAAFGCAVRFTSGPADRIIRIVLNGTQGPVGDVFGVRYERVTEAHGPLACGGA